MVCLFPFFCHEKSLGNIKMIIGKIQSRRDLRLQNENKSVRLLKVIVTIKTLFGFYNAIMKN